MNEKTINLSTMKVLLVDDNLDNIDILFKTLEIEGYNLAVATDGPQAIKIAEKFKPDLILLDIMMPEMDGFETCRRLKEMASAKDSPVIFVTAKRETEDIVKGFHCGGVDYISKPFRQEEICARVRTHLSLKALIKRQTDLIDELQHALAEVKTLSGLLPICASCKKIRDDEGYWHQIESYFKNHSDVNFSHGICEDCIKKLYPKLKNKKFK